ncbi:choline/ethanolaminephosphotransferase 1b isoform X2 [Alosa alosa]|uniref:choline/ethanolaminephosphotransferase 1b isoform X2 n=2 Tax=Alosa TaxID=34772 RepID=UPI0020150DF7|nr:choline/ethanolaminephosphotransferase 1b isoform X2 [Alosa alosa]
MIWAFPSAHVSNQPCGVYLIEELPAISLYTSTVRSFWSALLYILSGGRVYLSEDPSSPTVQRVYRGVAQSCVTPKWENRWSRAPLWIPNWSIGRWQAQAEQHSRAMSGQAGAGAGMRGRRGGRERDREPPLSSVYQHQYPHLQQQGMDASCWLAPSALRRLVELPSPPLSRHQLKRLEEHRYSSSGRSLLEPIMQRYWEWLVCCMPAWIAPNLITIVGLATNVFTTLVLVYYCPTATEQAPLWAYLLCAVGLFIYQSLDAIDGKQARRTNSSSPLGELFDHGCDSLSTVFVVLGTSIAVQLGTNPDWMFFCCFAGMFMFYCAHWQTYVSGTLRFGIFDVTEAQICLALLQMFTAIVGPRFWNITIPIINIQMKIVPAICTFIGVIFSCTNYFRVIFTGGVGKNGSTIAGTSVLSPVLHIGSVIILAMMIYKKSAIQLFEKHPCLYILAFGFVSAKITNKLVVAHMTKSEMHLHDVAFLGPGLLFLDQYFNSFIDEYLVLWIALILSFFDLVRYCVSVCNQIASHLHIFVFKIKPLTMAPIQ